jgi:cell division septum initiation protein DivIVA
MDIINVIDRLESLMTTSKSVPVSGNIIVDKKKVMELVDQLRFAIPQEVKAAEDVLAQKDQIVNQAMLEARRAKLQADNEYRDLMNQNEMVVNAEARAQDTLRDAEQRSSRMLIQTEAEAMTRRTDADAYALRSLRSLEEEINSIAGSVRKGIDYLAGQPNGKMVSPEAADD